MASKPLLQPEQPLLPVCSCPRVTDWSKLGGDGAACVLNHPSWCGKVETCHCQAYCCLWTDADRERAWKAYDAEQAELARMRKYLVFA